jgi:hypothetical protein
MNGNIIKQFIVLVFYTKPIINVLMWAVLVVKNDFVIVITNSINIIDIIINHVVIINRVVKLVFSSHKIPIKYFIIVVIGRCKFFIDTIF